MNTPKTQKEIVHDMLNKELFCHPSRVDEARIRILKDIVIRLAEQIDNLRTKIILKS